MEEISTSKRKTGSLFIKTPQNGDFIAARNQMKTLHSGKDVPQKKFFSTTNPAPVSGYQELSPQSCDPIMSLPVLNRINYENKNDVMAEEPQQEKPTSLFVLWITLTSFDVAYDLCKSPNKMYVKSVRREPKATVWPSCQNCSKL